MPWANGKKLDDPKIVGSGKLPYTNYQSSEIFIIPQFYQDPPRRVHVGGGVVVWWWWRSRRPWAPAAVGRRVLSLKPLSPATAVVVSGRHRWWSWWRGGGGGRHLVVMVVDRGGINFNWHSVLFATKKGYVLQIPKISVSNSTEVNKPHLGLILFLADSSRSRQLKYNFWREEVW